ncbi:MAG: universal stress protein [Syntrophomonadaceae bacterium]|nr:universal stress protein [Syntrophomonadaceae bacterium]
MFKNILVPVDGSEYSCNAAKAATSMGEKYGGKVTFLHVIAKSLDANLNIQDKHEILLEKITALRLEGYEILEKAIQNSSKDTVETKAILSWGNPADIILEKTEENKYDLIVMGNRGLGAIKGLLLGSVSEKVIKSIRCPVMIVKDL